MTGLIAVKVALDPSPCQLRLLASNAGGARFVFNFLLGRVIENYRVNREAKRDGEPEPGYMDVSAYGLRKYWNTVKDDVAPWWRENSKEAYSYACSCVSDGVRNWLKSKTGKRKGRRAGFPRFKVKHGTDPAFAYTTGFRQPSVDDPYHVWLPRIGSVHCMENVPKRVGNGRVIRMNVKRHAERWYVILTVERAVDPVPRVDEPDTVIGIDLGVNHLATLSDGTVVENPRYYKRGERRLAHAQKSLSRKVKGSKRYEKARARLSRAHAHVAYQRHDMLDKLTTSITRKYGVISIEDLSVQGMTRNHNLAGSILDAGFYEFRRMLEYKARLNGNTLYVAGKWYPSSKTCSSCGTVKAKLDLSERVYHCDKCRFTIERDLNAARNLAALAGSAPESQNERGGSIRRDPVQRGPASPNETLTKQGSTTL